MLVSSRADQESQGLSFGELSHKLRDLIDDKSCALDQDKDGQISLAELTATLPPVPMPKLRYPEVAAGQDMGYKGNFDWAQCIPLSGTDFKCRPPIKVGDVLEIATANVVPQMHGSYKVGGVCTLQPGDKVRVQKMISQMDATVQLPPNRGCPKSANIALTGTWNKTPLTQPQAETRSAATPSSAK